MTEKEIPNQNYDIIFKAMTEQFGQKALDFYGIHTAPIDRVEPSNLPRVNLSERRMDFVFSLTDGTYLHLEFQTTYNRRDLERFKLYDAALYEKKQRNIQTYVIYGADVKKAEERLSHGSIQYYAKAIYMKDFDGDMIFDKLMKKVQNQHTLTDEEQLQLIFLPLMNTRKERTNLAIETVNLTKKLADEDQSFRLMSTVIAISDKFLDNTYANKMMEVLRMTRVFRKIYEEGAEYGKAEGIAKGIAEGKQEDMKLYLESRFGLESPHIQDKIERISEIDVLNSLIAKLYKAETAEQAEKLIDQALQQQHVG